ncbi:hypothetical protein AMECASPLE_014594, partial [Ameca splendens]
YTENIRHDILNHSLKQALVLLGFGYSAGCVDMKDRTVATSDGGTSSSCPTLLT